MDQNWEAGPQGKPRNTGLLIFGDQQACSHLKEKEKNGRERKGEKCEEAEHETAGKKGIRYRSERKRKGEGRIKRRIWAKTFIKHSKEKQGVTAFCTSIIQ